MGFSKPQNRELVSQDFLSYALAVGITATPISKGVQQTTLQALYVTIAICCPSTAANSVWMGLANISATAFNGIEIVPGATFEIHIDNERQLYELQGPLAELECSVPVDIQFKAWDPTNIYLIASAPTTVGIQLFKGNFF